MTLAEIIAELQALQAAQATFTQADIDAAVVTAVTPLNDQIVALTAQVTAFPDQVHAAVLAEDASLAAKLKPILDELAALTV